MVRLELERLPKPEPISEPVAEVLNRIAEYSEVRFILIFGSRAIGDADDRSEFISRSPAG